MIAFSSPVLPKDSIPSILDSNTYTQSTSNMLSAKEILLKSPSLAGISQSVLSYDYNWIIRIIVPLDFEGSRPSSVEIAQTRNNKLYIIFKITAGDLINLDSSPYLAKEGIKYFFTDSISQKSRKYINGLYAYLQKYRSEDIGLTGTGKYHIEFADYRRFYYFKTILFTATRNENILTIITLVKSITKDIAKTKDFPDELGLIKKWADEQY
jgi:hypothetical protein